VRRQNMSRGTNSGKVVIRLNQRLFYGVVAVVGVIAVFFVGLWLGRTLLSPARQRRTASPQQQEQQQQQQLPSGQTAIPVQPGQQELVPPWEQEGIEVEGKATWPAGDDVPIGDNPRLALPELKEETNYTYDFGDIAPDQAVEKAFKIVNKGTKDLVIDDVSSTCGCTAVLLSESTILPGGEAELRVGYDPRMYEDKGFVQQKVRIKSNDPATPLVEFAVTANVVEK
jgi:hypothetical protein